MTTIDEAPHPGGRAARRALACASFAGVAMWVAACTTTPPPNPFEQAFDDDTKTWQEVSAKLPPMPKDRDLVGFSVSGATSFVFEIDASTLDIGSDGVFRYTLVATSPQGARNVSYEGIRCATGEKKIYATGRADGTWVRARNAAWTRIEEVGNNRQHAALETEYFCPDQYAARNVRDIVRRMRPRLPPSEAAFDEQTGGVAR